ncbi:MAG: EcsC family protein [Thermodesulfovibrionales bacterium]|nr:EcsC family protein [Thermodesulfovibrionales bacterium]
MEDEKESIKEQLQKTKEEYKELGGWESFRKGEWLWKLIDKAFKNYFEKADVEYFQKKYNTKDREKLAKKLISVAAKNASILGGITGIVISADEIVAILSGGEGGVGVPANIAIGLAAIGGEAILLIRFQLQLVANLGKLYEAPLDFDDPEDILTILAFAIGGSTAEFAGKAGMKIGGKMAGNAAKSFFSKELLASLKHVAAKIGIKVLQRSIVKYTVPVASIGIGVVWNYFITKAVGKIAIAHFKKRHAEIHVRNESELLIRVKEGK